MALINCPECKKEISSHSNKCPHCGCPSEESKKEKIGALLALGALIGLIILKKRDRS